MSRVEFKASEIQKVLDTAKGPTEPVYFVSDHGVYLMSEIRPKGGHIAFGLGFHPDQDKDWWNLKVELLGGDDFGEEVGTVHDWENFLSSRLTDKVAIDVSERALTLSR